MSHENIDEVANVAPPKGCVQLQTIQLNALNPITSEVTRFNIHRTMNPETGEFFFRFPLKHSEIFQEGLDEGLLTTVERA
ncbi:MAG: hypothetical protein AAGJ29_07435 [Pseudomonadota bacterium]